MSLTPILADSLTDSLGDVTHGFFTRQGGVSTGLTRPMADGPRTPHTG